MINSLGWVDGILFLSCHRNSRVATIKEFCGMYVVCSVHVKCKMACDVRSALGWAPRTLPTNYLSGDNNKADVGSLCGVLLFHRFYRLLSRFLGGFLSYLAFVFYIVALRTLQLLFFSPSPISLFTFLSPASQHTSFWLLLQSFWEGGKRERSDIGFTTSWLGYRVVGSYLYYALHIVDVGMYLTEWDF